MQSKKSRTQTKQEESAALKDWRELRQERHGNAMPLTVSSVRFSSRSKTSQKLVSMNHLGLELSLPLLALITCA